MSIEDAFLALQENVNADPIQVAEADQRREMFEFAFGGESDALTAEPSGSLGRRSQLEPINDVDLLWVYKPGEHPDWGEDGPSALEALEYTRDQVKRLLGSEEALVELFGEAGRLMKWVRETHLQHHAVKCFLDDPDVKGAFTVDVVPALPRPEGGFFIPESNNQKWIPTNPVYLIERVRERNGGYEEGQFVELLRVLKCWAKDNGGVIKGLAVEVLGLTHLQDLERSRAVARYFQGALEAIHDPILDPAGLCGEVQPNLDRAAAEALLEKAADTSARAVAAAERGEERQAQCLWRELFGDVFPEPEGGCEKTSGGAEGATFGIISSRPARKVQSVEEG